MMTDDGVKKKAASTRKKPAAGAAKTKKASMAKSGGTKRSVAKKKATTKPVATNSRAASQKKTAEKSASTRKSTSRPAAGSVSQEKAAASKASKQIENELNQDKKNPGLLSFFKNMHKSQVDHDQAQEKIITDFSERVEESFVHFHEEFDERERLLEKKLKRLEQEQVREIRRVKWISVPIGLVAFISLVYIFYVVHVMERSMTSMSADMQQISGHILTMSEDTRYMSTSMEHMNQNMGAIRYTMAPIGKAAHDAQPMMSAMRRFSPF